MLNSVFEKSPEVAPTPSFTYLPTELCLSPPGSTILVEEANSISDVSFNVQIILPRDYCDATPQENFLPSFHNNVIDTDISTNISVEDFYLIFTSV